MANPLNLFGGPKGIRTPVTDVRGQCPRPLDDGTTFLRINCEVPRPEGGASRKGSCVHIVPLDPCSAVKWHMPAIDQLPMSQ